MKMSFIRSLAYFLCKNVWVFKKLKRHSIKKRLKRLHAIWNFVARAKSHQQWSLCFPQTHSNRSRCMSFLFQHCKSFIPLATAHYNSQLDTFSAAQNPYYAKTDFESMLDLAENYFIRNRSRLFEWWCLYGDGQGKFLTAEDHLRLDLGWTFDEVFKLKMSSYQPPIDVNPDKDHYNGGIPCISQDGNPRSFFMREVMLRAKTSNALAKFVVGWFPEIL